MRFVAANSELRRAWDVNAPWKSGSQLTDPVLRFVRKRMEEVVTKTACLNMDQTQETRYQPTELKNNWQILMMITLKTVLLLARLLYTVLALTSPNPLSWASEPTILWRTVSICSNSSTERMNPSKAAGSKSCPTLAKVLLTTGDHQTAMQADGSKRRSSILK